MSHGRDSGRGSRPNEPGKLAIVRWLHLDDGDGSITTATEEWYETERLTGQITGGARSHAPGDRPAPANDRAPLVLDWRHAEATPPPTALERLGHSLDLRYRRRRKPPDAPRPDTQRCERQQPTPPARETAPSQLAAERAAPGGEPIRAELSGPELALRKDRALEHPTRRSRPRDRGRSRVWWAAVSVVVLSVCILSTIAIASQMSSPTANRQAGLIASPSRGSGFIAATSAPDAALNSVLKKVIGSLAGLERQVRIRKAERRARLAHRRPRRKTSDRAGSASGQRPVSSVPPAAVSAPPSTTSYSNPSQDRTLSSSPAYNSQPATSGSAPAAAPSAPQPAGPIGPGGTVGSNCNPKCS